MTKPTKWCAHRDDSDQHGHPPSLIRVYTGRCMHSSAPKFTSGQQLRLIGLGIQVLAAHTVHLVGFNIIWLFSRCNCVLGWWWQTGSATVSQEKVSIFHNISQKAWYMYCITNFSKGTMIVLSFWTDRNGQLQAWRSCLINGLHCLTFCLHVLEPLLFG